MYYYVCYLQATSEYSITTHIHHPVPKVLNSYGSEEEQYSKLHQSQVSYLPPPPPPLKEATKKHICNIIITYY